MTHSPPPQRAPLLPAGARQEIRPGRSWPLGATWDGHGVNFALYSEHADAVELLLFDTAYDPAPARTVVLPERTGPVWHGYLPGLRPGRLYGYRVHGPFAPAEGHRFNGRKVLLDPYARAIGRPLLWHPSLQGSALRDGREVPDERDSAAFAPLGAVVDGAFAWGDDRPPEVPWERTVLYETHVKGLTMRHPGVPPELRGTYLGLASPPVVRHLLELGVTAVQLQPVQSFVQDRRLVEQGLANYWGYNPLGYFAPEGSYSSSGPIEAVTDFKKMVRALHAAGLEVLIDVVYNHTGEGDHLGPTLSWRGIDNRSYYKLRSDPSRYRDYTGTGNTLDAGNPFVLQLVMDSLRYWVQEMRVDGFRFDLASTLGREGRDVDMLAAFFQTVQQDPVLSRVKLVAEPWDVGPGGYQLGNFPWRWSEWNGRYRDAVRGYWAGGEGVAELATRLSGSSDLYGAGGRSPTHSINFVTAHDGFTLEDLVSYERKHNEANGEGNRDGHDHNLSANLGVEGPTDDPEVRARRELRKRGLLATLMLSHGVPMLLGGDEIGRTQNGNNNAYCQDNETSWYDWRPDERRAAFLAFTRRLIRFRHEHTVLRRRRFLTGRPDEDGRKDIAWLHPDGRELADGEWEEPSRSALGMLLTGSGTDDPGATPLLVLFHGRHEGTFRLPDPPAGTGLWELAFSTALDTGEGAGVRRRAGDEVGLERELVEVYEAVDG